MMIAGGCEAPITPLSFAGKMINATCNIHMQTRAQAIYQNDHLN
jgi:hypothetical protein